MTTTSPDILITILSSRDLPTLPVVATKILDLMAREETSLAEIANVAAQDMGLATKILRTVNSSLYSFPKHINSINQAVSILGINSVRSLVLSFSFLSMRGENTYFDFVRFWERSLFIAAAAKVIAEQLPDIDGEELFTAGLLQNIGQLVFACTIPSKYEQILQKAATAQGVTDEENLEKVQLGITHSMAGYEVAKKWGLPEALLHAIRFHHAPMAYTGSNEQLGRNSKIVYLAGLLGSIYSSAAPEVIHRRFRQESKELLGIKVLTINTILEQLSGKIDSFAKYFDLDIPPTKSVTEILHEANLKLSLLALSNEEKNRELINSKIQLEKLTAELKHKNALLENLANIDHLTGVANHRHLQTFLARELNPTVGNGDAVSLLLVDIDRFKNVNDTYGHTQGDFILKEFCRITQKIIRNKDLLARYGGEEFIVILPATDLDDAVAVAEKIRKSTEDQVFSNNQFNIRITVSIGVFSYRPTDGAINNQVIIGNADEALYMAKINGRNRVVPYKSGRTSAENKPIS